MSNNKQTPKEKAKELCNKFMSIDSDSEKFDGFKMGFFYAQRCALIAVNEILNNFGTLTEGKQHYAAYSTIKFYEQVKQEIEKL